MHVVLPRARLGDAQAVTRCKARKVAAKGAHAHGCEKFACRAGLSQHVTTARLGDLTLDGASGDLLLLAKRLVGV